MGIANIIGAFCVIFLVLCAFMGITTLVRFFFLFHARKCRHCGHTLDFKGYHEERRGSHYKFYCRHCNSWENIDRNELFRDGEEEEAAASGHHD